MEELKFILLRYATLIIFGVLVAIAGFVAVWWEGRQLRDVLVLPAGTLIHVNGMPFRLRERTLVFGREENLRG